MVRKRKVPILEEEKENEDDIMDVVSASGSTSGMANGPMFTIMSNVQLNETFHKKYIKQLKRLYSEMDHDAFFFTFIKMIKTAMEAEESNEYAHTTLLFCAKFVSSFDGEDTHRLLLDTFSWIMTTISNNPHIRFRLCQFVNTLLNALGLEAALDDIICDRILDYMLDRLRDVSANVRLQAILAMQRLQVPNNPDDPVLRAYQFHLCSDPSPRVRQAVITAMGRNYHTIPYILDRLWDIDEKVRRHTYLHMSSYPVRTYKVAQRLTLLEQGLNDRSELVRKVVTTIMLQQWIESYQKNLISLISALKLDSNEDELNRFQKITKQTLNEIFKRQSKEDLIACVPLEEDSEFHLCIPHEKLTIETAIYWQCLTKYLLDESAEEVDLIMPELSAFCSYVEKFCVAQKAEMDKFELMDFQCKLLSLVEILYTFDLGDEIGRGNLKKLLTHLLTNFNVDEKIIKIVVQCAENLITDQNTRLQFFVDIINDICALNAKQDDLVHNRALVEDLLRNSTNPDLKFELSSLKLKILDLEEQKANYEQFGDYEKVQIIDEQRITITDDYIELLKPLLELYSRSDLSGRLTNVVKNETILKSLQIAFHMVVTTKVKSLNHSICQLYKDFICRHIASNQIAIRNWALKCGTAYSMLYEALAKGVFTELCQQFFRNNNVRIWETSILCIFELLERYGLDNFVVEADQSKSKRPGRQLYNSLEFLDMEDDNSISMDGQEVRIIYMMSHFLDQCEDVCITKAIITGFCRLVLRGLIKTSDIIEKLLLRYFNPSTDAGINQILGVFLENLIERKRHGLLQQCLLPTISTVLNAPYESPLHEIRPETITRFFIDATRQEPCSGIDTMHNKLAKTFLQEMLNNINNKELCKLLAKEITTLELNVSHNASLKHEMKSMADTLIKSDFDPRTIRNIINFKDMLDGTFLPPPVLRPDGMESDYEGKSDDGGETVSSVQQCNTQRDDAITTNDSETMTSEAETLAPALSETAVHSESEIGALDATLMPRTPASSQAALNTTNPNESSAPTTPTPQDVSATTALAPTTYGRNNIVGQRYLRKSLNLSRGQSDSESGDGPTRPPKIRIEARIDSDKKESSGTTLPPAPTPTPQQSPDRGVTNTRPRRNLRNMQQGAAANNASPTVEKRAVGRAAAHKNAKATPPRQTRRRKESETANESVASSTKQRGAAHSLRDNSEDDDSEDDDSEDDDNEDDDNEDDDDEEDDDDDGGEITTSKNTTKNTRTPGKLAKHTAGQSSPKVAAAQSPRTTRRTAALQEAPSSDFVPPSPPAGSPRLAALRQARNGTLRVRLPQLPAKFLQPPTRNSASKKPRDGAATTATTTTPLRNGRKRVLRRVNDGNQVSPRRKQRRSESPGAKGTQASPLNTMRRRSMSISSSGSSVCSTTSARLKSRSAKVTRSLSAAAAAVVDGTDGMRRRKRRAANASGAGVGTSSPQLRGIKRKRYSLESSDSAGGGGVNAQSGVVVANNESSSTATSSSSNEEIVTRRSSRRRLIAKMTRINIRAPGYDGPVPMLRARVTRAATPPPQPPPPPPPPLLSSRTTRKRK